MPKFRKIPAIIEAEKFTGEPIPGCSIKENQTTGQYEVHNQLHDSWIKLKVGDMVRTDQAPEDVYPIDKETFKETYEKVND